MPSEVESLFTSASSTRRPTSVVSESFSSDSASSSSSVGGEVGVPSEVEPLFTSTFSTTRTSSVASESFSSDSDSASSSSSVGGEVFVPSEIESLFTSTSSTRRPSSVGGEVGVPLKVESLFPSTSSPISSTMVSSPSVPALSTTGMSVGAHEGLSVGSSSASIAARVAATSPVNHMDGILIGLSVIGFTVGLGDGERDGDELGFVVRSDITGTVMEPLSSVVSLSKESNVSPPVESAGETGLDDADGWRVGDNVG